MPFGALPPAEPHGGSTTSVQLLRSQLRCMWQTRQLKRAIRSHMLWELAPLPVNPLAPSPGAELCESLMPAIDLMTDRRLWSRDFTCEWTLLSITWGLLAQMYQNITPVNADVQEAITNHIFIPYAMGL